MKIFGDSFKKYLYEFSADFNFETSSAGGGGGSLPNTPLRTPRSFNFPPFCATAANTPATSAASGSLDLSIKRVESGDEEEAETAAIPTINVIKPEPEDSGEDTARSGGCSPPPPLHFVTTVTKSSPGNRGGTNIIKHSFHDIVPQRSSHWSL